MKHPPLRGHAIISFPSTSEVRDSNAMKIRSSSGRIYFRLRICLECLSREQNYSMKPSEYRGSFHESYWRRRRRLLHYGLDIFGFSIFLRAPLLDVRIVKILQTGAISFHVSRSSGNLPRRVDRCKRFGASSSSSLFPRQRKRLQTQTFRRRHALRRSKRRANKKLRVRGNLEMDGNEVRCGSVRRKFLSRRFSRWWSWDAAKEIEMEWKREERGKGWKAGGPFGPAAFLLFLFSVGLGSAACFRLRGFETFFDCVLPDSRNAPMPGYLSGIRQMQHRAKQERIGAIVEKQSKSNWRGRGESGKERVRQEERRAEIKEEGRWAGRRDKKKENGKGRGEDGRRIISDCGTIFIAALCVRARVLDTCERTYAHCVALLFLVLVYERNWARERA